MAEDINRVTLTGNLTRDPELKALQSGTSVCNMRLASNARRKVQGEWQDKANYIDITVWGAQGENCAKYLQKGSPIAVDGKLDWREWETQEGGKRQTLQVIADSIRFLGGGPGQDGGSSSGFTPRSDVPVDASDFAPPASAPAAGTPEEDIPF